MATRMFWTTQAAVVVLGLGALAALGAPACGGDSPGFATCEGAVMPPTCNDTSTETDTETPCSVATDCPGVASCCAGVCAPYGSCPADGGDGGGPSDGGSDAPAD